MTLWDTETQRILYLFLISKQDANMSGTGEQIILVGAASKGIIQRDFQHNATVYKQPFSKNPFDSVTNEELEAYKQSIENKNRGEVDF